jgi:hypothetical protein
LQAADLQAQIQRLQQEHAEQRALMEGQSSEATSPELVFAQKRLAVTTQDALVVEALEVWELTVSRRNQPTEAKENAPHV